MSLAVSQVYAEDGKEDKVAVSLAQENWDGKIVQYGTMHEAIGQKQYEGRVSLDEVVNKPHFYGVAALEKLKGEATFSDSGATITVVTADGGLNSIKEKQIQATLLAGAYVSFWSEHKIEKDTPPSELDNLIRNKAVESGFDVSKPFVFTLDGEFSEVKLHVINGECPMHARLRKIEIPKESKPFEGEYTRISGKVIGIYASNAVGILTHPDTSTHLHLIFKDEVSGEMVTGHVEQLGLVSGVILKLPLKS
ncbi:MAG: hypothetical protein A2Y04_03625 [Omnitrophica WOR_2 bacterium GWC2_45_7]|nr:MAG: hypothetical protein A2Y04_03625 [Omnitrophica WOR_2 bacterium GWC2_45_7]